MSPLRLLHEKFEGSPFPLTTNCLYFIHKGLYPFIRGLRFRPFLGSCRGAFFVGRGTRIIHAKRLHVGYGCYIGDYGFVDCLCLGDVRLGNRVTIREFAWLQLTSNLREPGIEILIGSHTYIGPRATLGAAAPLHIGSGCQIGANVSFVAESHRYEDASRPIHEQGVTRKGIRVGDDCWIGNGAIVLDGVSIGTGAVVGAGAVVTRPVPAGAVVAGVPARTIKIRGRASISPTLEASGLQTQDHETRSDLAAAENAALR